MFVCLQVESETAESELRLSNATLRLLQLERDVTMLRESSLGTRHHTQHTERLSETAKQDAERALQVHTHRCTRAHTAQYFTCQLYCYPFSVCVLLCVGVCLLCVGV